MGSAKRVLYGVFIIALAGICSYFIFLNVFSGLKIKGYSYLFRATEPYDLVIKHAMIIDGTGENEVFRGDLAIRDGRIVGVGYVNPKESPVFDAGGLTIIPWPVQLEKSDVVVEHLLATAYPRYAPEQIFFQEGEYQGLSLAEAACLGEVEPEELVNSSPAKVLLAPLEIKQEEAGIEELLAGLTGYRASLLGLYDKGAIKKDCFADFYFFKTADYTEDQLLKIFRTGNFPEPVFKVLGGEFLNQ